MGAGEKTLTKPAAERPCLTEPEADIRICLGTGGVAAGSREVLAAFEEEIKRTGVMALIRPREDKCAERERLRRLKDFLFHTFDVVATAAYARETAPQRK